MTLFAYSVDKGHVVLDLRLPTSILPFSEHSDQLCVVLFVVLQGQVPAYVGSDQDEGDLVVVFLGVGLKGSGKAGQEVDL